MKKMRFTALLLVSALCASVLGGCSQSKEAPKASEAKTEAAAQGTGETSGEIKMQKLITSHHTSAHGLPSYIALKKGWFEDAGLDVELMIYTAGGPQMEALATDAWEIGTSGTPGAVIGMLN